MADYEINKKLAENKCGNYQIKVTHIGSKRRSEFCSYEYYVTVKYQITDVMDSKRKFGVVAPGFGAKPIELNVDRTDSFMFYDHQNFDQALLEILTVRSNWINLEGYYPKEGRAHGIN
tara:strand:- start:217 stop:570 length:354 start_codon:yes stop_codon:yes gene_type:complete